MIKKNINELIVYAKLHLGLQKKDEVFYRNIIAGMLNVTEIETQEVDEKTISKMQVPDEILNNISKHIKEKKLVDDAFVPNFIAKLIGIITPLPSVVQNKFDEYYKESPIKATDYLYNLSIKNNYIQKTAIDKNIWWKTEFEQGEDLEITINLSKPEKNNKDIAKLLTQKATNYPKCPLCYDNVGFSGDLKKAARQTLRTIDLILGGEDWFLQYSPYSYYEEHCIIINKKHRPMRADKNTFIKMCDFVDKFPHYFVGSNACLPIVGGSILNHEHYQGGLHLMPLHHAKEKWTYIYDECKNVKISILDWYNSCIRIESKNRDEVINVATHLLNVYLKYNDKDAYLFSEIDNVQHSAITPLCRIRDGKYCIEIILRNNIANEEHPDGVFHAHKEYHDVKSEGIGLIEAMGLFILPPRLLKNMKINSTKYSKEYINNTCRNILRNTAIFKNDEAGNKQFKKFMSACEFKEVNV